MAIRGLAARASYLDLAALAPEAAAFRLNFRFRLPIPAIPLSEGGTIYSGTSLR